MTTDRCRVWRIVREKYVPAALTGDGARDFGGRWNSEGTAVVYCAQSLALAFLEVLVHSRKTDRLQDLVRIPIDVPPERVLTPALGDFPADISAAVPQAPTQGFGDRWAQAAQSLALRVPCSLMDHEWNYLLNPAHPAWSELVIGEPEPHPVDRRLRR